MAKYDMGALTAWATKSATQFWSYATRKYATHGINIGDMPTVIMNPRLTSTAGRAWPDEWKIDLSCYLMIRNWDYFHYDIIPHELCHLIADKLYHSTGHDRHWYHVVDFLGVKTNRLHSMKTKNMQGK